MKPMRDPKRIFMVVGLAGLLYVLGQYVASQPLRVQQETEAQREITVTGTAELTTTPDVAKLTLGVTTGPQPTAERAIELLAERFNAVLAAVKKQGIEEDDLKTFNVSINPSYDYTDGRQELRGFEARESIEVTIRDLDTIGDVLSVSVLEGVNQAGNIQFSIDDPDELEQQAQAEAIDDAKAKAKDLAKQLGVSLGNVKSFSASNSKLPTQLPYARAELTALGADEAVAPEVPVGTQDVAVTVNVTYEIR